MNKLANIVAILNFMLLSSMIVTTSGGPPPINRPMQLKIVGIQGGNPETVDYSWAYDTQSGEIIQNVQDTLVTFNAEHVDEYLPRIATNWTGPSGGLRGYFSAILLGGIDSGDPISGLNFENPANQTGPNATYYYRYVFEIRQGIFFQPPYNYSLTPADVAYSFQRSMVQDRTGGPQWMLQEPLLDNPAGDDASAGGIADLTNATQVAELGALIRDSVQYNATHVWFNLMYPSPYAPFMQILTQTWSSIISKQWINNQVITGAGRPDWNGDWSSLTAWNATRNPNTSPLDDPTPMMYGSGPYRLLTLDRDGFSGFWEMTRYVGYWAGWPADYPSLAGRSPGGWVDDVYKTWAIDWGTAKSMFLAGDTDFVDVPLRSFIPELYNSTTPPYQPPNYPLNGTRCINPLPILSVNSMFFTFRIDPTTPYGPIGPNGIYNETLIPSDFFSNINVRKAFAYAFDYDNYTATAYLGEASHPATAIIPGLNYYDPMVTGYSYDLATANASLNSVGPDSNGKMLKDVGFTITLVYVGGSTFRGQAQKLLKSAIESLNPHYHLNLQGISWTAFLTQGPYHLVPLFSLGWLADFPDPHDVAPSFYASWGQLPLWQDYANTTMDALVNQGIATPDGPARAAIYKSIQQLAVADVPSFTLVQYQGRHFERDWVQGYYYNPSYPGFYFYNLWKWYYVPDSLQDTSTAPAGYNEPVDVNYDGKVDMKDIGTVAKSFGATYGPPLHPRWVFRADVNLDRKIDMKDIGYVAKQFGKNSVPWPLVKPTMTPSSISTKPGTPVTFTETLSGALAAVNYAVWSVSEWPDPLVQRQMGPSLTFNYTFPASGTYYVVNEVAYTLNTPNGNVTTSACAVATVTVTSAG